VSFISNLMDDPKVRPRVASMSSADKFQLHIYAALAEQERTFISARTKAALREAKAHKIPARAKVDQGRSLRAPFGAASALVNLRPGLIVALILTDQRKKKETASRIGCAEPQSRRGRKKERGIKHCPRPMLPMLACGCAWVRVGLRERLPPRREERSALAAPRGM
jgi:hypothetical protein